ACPQRAPAGSSARGMATAARPQDRRPHAPSGLAAMRERRSPMRTPQAEGWTRRRFLGGLTVAGTAGLLGLPARPVAAEPPPETTRLRLVRGPGLCVAPEYVAEELLQGEGFHRGAVRQGRERSRQADGARRWRGRPHPVVRRAVSPATGGGSPGRPAGGCARRLLRAVRDGAGPRDPRSEGENRRGGLAGNDQPRVP